MAIEIVKIDCCHLDSSLFFAKKSTYVVKNVKNVKKGLPSYVKYDIMQNIADFAILKLFTYPIFLGIGKKKKGDLKDAL